MVDRGGCLIVTANGPDGAEYDFVLGLGMTLITEGGAATIGASISSLTIGGIPVDTEQASTVPDSYLEGAGNAVGVLGGLTLNSFDILIDAPNGKLLLQPVGRSVRWDDVALSNPVRLLLFHDVLARIDVEVGGAGFGGLIDLAAPYLEVNDAVRTKGGLSDGKAPAFRMGYAGWTDLPARVTESRLFDGWDPDGNGFVIIGAPVAYDCAIAISWAHAEFQTCIR
jgi:hypothetical protein